MTAPLITHEVINQVPALDGGNAFAEDPAAEAALSTYGADWGRDHAVAFGATVRRPDTQRAAHLAHRHLPELHTHDRWGRRIDEVEFHPSYHQLMDLAFGDGVHALAWTDPRPGSHVVRAVLSYLWNQVDGGTACPTGMAYAAIPTLCDEPGLAVWADRVSRFAYDPAPVDVEHKRAATIGYAMTEKQGGSDLRANTTTAVPAATSGDRQYVLRGHKWFCSAPMSDAFFTVARAEAGPSCFLVPRWLPDGTRNGIHIQRLKDKCGNRANASSEIEYHDAVATLVGEEGKGIRTILGSSDYTRLDFAVGSAGLMRAALGMALHHARHRRAFGASLVDQPMMAEVLTDLTLEWWAAAHLGFRVAATADRDDEGEWLLGRLLTPTAKYWNCKRAPVVVAETLECIGGNGYVEEHPMARFYREAPLNAIWEGTSNMMVADVERVLTRDPKVIEPYLDELRLAQGANAHLDEAIRDLDGSASNPLAVGARRLTTSLAVTLQAALLVRHAPAPVADAFCASRLGGDWSLTFGTLPPATDCRAILAAAGGPSRA